MHYILSDEDQITYNYSSVHTFLFSFYHIMVSTYVYMYYTLCMTLVSPRCSLRREMSICTFYIRTLIATLSCFNRSRSFWRKLLFQKLSAVLPQCRPPKYFTIVSDYDLRPFHAQFRSFPVFLIPIAGRGSVACPRHLPFGSRNRSST